MFATRFRYKRSICGSPRVEIERLLSVKDNAVNYAIARRNGSSRFPVSPDVSLKERDNLSLKWPDNENEKPIRTHLVMTVVHIVECEILPRISLSVRQLVVNEVTLGYQLLVELQVQSDLLLLPRLVFERQVRHVKSVLGIEEVGRDCQH